nr:saccharopine dehydrogenase-like oxidoreductase [Onthophagus taurus]
MANSRLDIIIFGATGFTGLRTIPELVRILDKEKLNLKWGIAGRSYDKLKNTLNQIKQRTGFFFNVPIIMSDINDEKSIRDMTSRTKLLIDTVGPYRNYGEIVVKACLETGTHYLDISGEASFQEGMQLKYHEDALKKGVYLISSCGIGSVPTDLGVIFLQNNFKGTLNSVETYTSLREEGGPYTGPMGHTGTWESIILCLAYPFEQYKVRSKLFKIMPKAEVTPKLANKFIHKCRVTKKWALPLPEPDKATITRSQKYLYQLYNQRPVQVENYIEVNHFLYVPIMMIIGFLIVFFSQFSFTRNLLIKYPKLFSFGLFGHEGPSEERQNNLIYETTLCGEGWPGKLSEPTDKFTTKPTKKIVGKVIGRNPAYGATCIALAACAITLLVEKDKMPNNGGCYPPGAAFAKTSLIERLQRYNFKFELVSN